MTESGQLPTVPADDGDGAASSAADSNQELIERLLAQLVVSPAFGDMVRQFAQPPNSTPTPAALPPQHNVPNGSPLVEDIQDDTASQASASSWHSHWNPDEWYSYWSHTEKKWKWKKKDLNKKTTSTDYDKFDKPYLSHINFTISMVMQKIMHRIGTR